MTLLIAPYRGNQFCLTSSSKKYINSSCLRSLSYRNQFNDLRCKLVDWFLYDRDFSHETVNSCKRKINLSRTHLHDEVCKIKFKKCIVACGHEVLKRTRPVLFWNIVMVKNVIQKVIQNFSGERYSKPSKASKMELF